MTSDKLQERVVQFLVEALSSLTDDGGGNGDSVIDANTPLIGDNAVIDSRALVELLIALEEFLEEEYGATFDWASDRAMSATNSPFKTATSLAHFALSDSGL